MSMIDLSSLPPPDVVESLDFEAVYQARAAQFSALYPDFVSLLESDPCVKLLELIAYLEIQLRGRINDSARAVMLASSGGTDLEHLAALYGVTRRVIDPGDSEAVPQVAPTYESDAALKLRVQLAPESFTSCGTFEAYRFHALAAAGAVLDAAVLRPTPGTVRVVLLSREGDGKASMELVEQVQAALSARDVRSVNDSVEVVGAEIRPYAVAARLVLYPGPAGAPVLAAAEAAVRAYAARTQRLGYDVTRSGLYAALHQAGVQRVLLDSPAEDLVCDQTQASWLTGAAITLVDATDV